LTPLPSPSTLDELNDFLKSVERRAFKRTAFAVRDEDSALDIVQDAMIRLTQSYADRPSTLDWFRRQKVRNAVFQNLGDFESSSDDGDGDFDLLESLRIDEPGTEGAEDTASRGETLKIIESEVEKLPTRQREAFLLRYWEELDVAETAAAMGCSEGSVKTHCSRAVQALSKALHVRGITL